MGIFRLGPVEDFLTWLESKTFRATEVHPKPPMDWLQDWVDVSKEGLNWRLESKGMNTVHGDRAFFYLVFIELIQKLGRGDVDPELAKWFSITVTGEAYSSTVRCLDADGWNDLVYISQHGFGED